MRALARPAIKPRPESVVQATALALASLKPLLMNIQELGASDDVERDSYHEPECKYWANGKWHRRKRPEEGTS
jgi:hypothetical protein